MQAQAPTQTIRGQLRDRESGAPMAAARVVVYKDSTAIGGTLSDSLGRYKIEAIPVGRYTIAATYMGYQTRTIPDVVVNSGKEVVMDLELEESIVQLADVEIFANPLNQSLNDMATVSARTFSIENTDRFGGSRGDPARMASNFAGVRNSDDSRNDIVIRGNSPLGLVYRLEGMDIPNPNHFSIFGSAGGPVGMLSNKVLANSDFLTGAFPAEYGNAVAGIFDLKMRNGNNEKREFSGQVGLMGLELMTEGPISRKSRSSYMAMYRYSTLKGVQAIGIDIGSTAAPKYQDIAFKFNFPNRHGGNFAVFGMGGISKIDILNCERDATDIYDDDLGKDVRFGSKMGLVGATYMHLLGEKTYLRLGLIATGGMSQSNQDTLAMPAAPCGQNMPGEYQRQNLLQHKIGLTAVLNHKFSPRHSLRSGVILERVGLNGEHREWNNEIDTFQVSIDNRSSHLLARAFTQWKYKIAEKLTLNTGLHAMFFALNGSTSLEPRLGLRWDLATRHSLNLGYGYHSQLQPLQIYHGQYLNADGSYGFENRDLGFTRSHHLVAGWDYRIANNFRMRLETYFQDLSNVPVEARPSSFSMVNAGVGFDMLKADTALVNGGTATNYGVELTLEKFFSKNYFFLLTGSLFESKYVGSDGIQRNTDFNGQFAANLLGGVQLNLGKKKASSINIGPKVTFAGGRRYTPIDSVASALVRDAVYIDSLAYTQQFKNYFRVDMRVSLRLNRPKVSHEIAIDLINMLGIKNPLTILYNPDLNRLV
ncbi:MAG TPA: TonB-dependent receptor, partial [Bacteroidia bacterium]|nr:TonB-dependent receptor [Bacteroidia bacterium]